MTLTEERHPERARGGTGCRFAGSGPRAQLPGERLSLCAAAMTNPLSPLWNLDLPLRLSVDQITDDLPLEANRCCTPSFKKMLTCDLGDMSVTAKRIALVGNSHATLLIPALWSLLLQNKWRLTTF